MAIYGNARGFTDMTSAARHPAGEEQRAGGDDEISLGSGQTHATGRTSSIRPRIRKSLGDPGDRHRPRSPAALPFHPQRDKIVDAGVMSSLAAKRNVVFATLFSC